MSCNGPIIDIINNPPFSNSQFFSCLPTHFWENIWMSAEDSFKVASLVEKK